MSAAVPASRAKSEESILSWFPIHDFFSLDLRSLALFRIGMGVNTKMFAEGLNRIGRALAEVLHRLATAGLLRLLHAAAGFLQFLKGAKSLGDGFRLIVVL